MKIYIASSWKNEVICLNLAELIRGWGHEVDCFCDSSRGRYVFRFSEIGDPSTLNAINFLADERSKRAFKEDKKHTDWADCIVMVLPCGNSSHLEAGYAKGKGKILIILGEFPVGEFDVMYGFADALVKLPDLKQTLKEEEKNL